MIHYNNEIKQGSQAWLDLRKGKVTASNAIKLLNNQKISTGSNGQSFAMERGTILEPQARQLYEKIKGVKVQEVGFITNDRYPNAGYSPDGVVDSGLLEIKCFGTKNHNQILRGEISMAITAQIQFGMLIAEQPWCDLVAYNPQEEPKNAIKIIRVFADQDIQNNIIEKLKLWKA